MTKIAKTTPIKQPTLSEDEVIRVALLVSKELYDEDGDLLNRSLTPFLDNQWHDVSREEYEILKRHANSLAVKDGRVIVIRKLPLNNTNGNNYKDISEVLEYCQQLELKYVARQKAAEQRLAAAREKAKELAEKRRQLALARKLKERKQAEKAEVDLVLKLANKHGLKVKPVEEQVFTNTEISENGHE